MYMQKAQSSWLWLSILSKQFKVSNVSLLRRNRHTFTIVRPLASEKLLQQARSWQILRTQETPTETIVTIIMPTPSDTAHLRRQLQPLMHHPLI